MLLHGVFSSLWCDKKGELKASILENFGLYLVFYLVGGVYKMSPFIMFEDC